MQYAQHHVQLSGRPRARRHCPRRQRPDHALESHVHFCCRCGSAHGNAQHGQRPRQKTSSRNPDSTWQSDLNSVHGALSHDSPPAAASHFGTSGSGGIVDDFVGYPLDIGGGHSAIAGDHDQRFGQGHPHQYGGQQATHGTHLNYASDNTGPPPLPPPHAALPQSHPHPYPIESFDLPEQLGTRDPNTVGDPTEWVDGNADVTVYGNHPSMPPLPSSIAPSPGSLPQSPATSSTITSPPSRRTSLRRPHAHNNTQVPKLTSKPLPAPHQPLPPPTPPEKKLPFPPPSSVPPLVNPLPSPKPKPKPLAMSSTKTPSIPPSTVSPVVPMFMELAIPDDGDDNGDDSETDHSGQDSTGGSAHSPPNPSAMEWVTSPLVAHYPPPHAWSPSPLTPNRASPAATNAFTPIDPLSPTLQVDASPSPSLPSPVPPDPAHAAVPNRTPTHGSAPPPQAIQQQQPHPHPPRPIIPDELAMAAPLPTQAIYDHVDSMCTWLHATLFACIQAASRTNSTSTSTSTLPAPAAKLVSAYAAVTGRATTPHPRANVAALVALVVRAAAGYVWTRAIVDEMLAHVNDGWTLGDVEDQAERDEVKQLVGWHVASLIVDAATPQNVVDDPRILAAARAQVDKASRAIAETLGPFVGVLPDVRLIATKLMLAHVVWRCGTADRPLEIHVPRPGDAFDVAWQDAGLSLDDGAQGRVVVTSFPGLVLRDGEEEGRGRVVYRAKVWCDPE
ncbi:hypothetical protein BCR44DRAFT_1111527 [Catenaria anguillulae PL171]|uniref:Uncharacterized protein n=1 Tax=Catenaria anguillulae PL171 TaxID=765915 RepID=A0A1Y2H6T9_9FUNG|nr:hypothetical protein BCR44DRAFT_1111527 [Catenaria anguillulae PL171]